MINKNVYLIFIVLFFLSCKFEKQSLREEISFNNFKKIVKYYNSNGTLNKIYVYDSDTLVKSIYTRNGEKGIRNRSDSFPVFLEDSCYYCDQSITYLDDLNHLSSFNRKFDFYFLKILQVGVVSEFKLIDSDTNRVQNIFRLDDTTIITNYVIKWVNPNNNDTLSRIPIFYKE